MITLGPITETGAARSRRGLVTRLSHPFGVACGLVDGGLQQPRVTPQRLHDVRFNCKPLLRGGFRIDM